MLHAIPCVIMRGGTSKGLFFLDKDLPPPGAERDTVLLRVMGSPDLRQIDGLGGSVSTTSKVAIIGSPSRPDADVDYTFAQVSVDKALVDYKGNCGNISSAVGPFALEEELVAAACGSGPGETVVRVHNTNTKKVILARVPTMDGKVLYDGDFAISGVPGTAARIALAFRKPAGAVTGKLLPTGNAVDRLQVEGLGVIEASIVDAANPLVFVRARDLGMDGSELPERIDGDADLLRRLEAVRGTAAVVLGLASSWQTAAVQSPAVPKMTVVAPPLDLLCSDGSRVAASGMDLSGRMMSMQKTHKTYALTGALCTVCAAAVKGGIVAGVARPGADLSDFRIGHPGGVIGVGVKLGSGGSGGSGGEAGSGEPEIEEALGYRTARLLMRGTAYYRGISPEGGEDR